MLANLQLYAHTLDDPIRISALPDEFPQRQQHHHRVFHLDPFPALANPFDFRALPEPRLQLPSLRQQHQTPLSKDRGPPGAHRSSTATTEASAVPSAGIDNDSPSIISATTALTDFLDLVASQTPTALFEWNAPALRFQWRPPAKKQRRNNGDSTSTRISGFSPDSTLSASRPFLKVATLIRRAGAVLDALVDADTGAGSGAAEVGASLPREAHALVFALRQVLDWLRRELIEWQDQHMRQLQSVLPERGGDATAKSTAGTLSSGIIDSDSRALLIILEAASGLSSCELILDAVSEMLNCPFTRNPPFKPLPGLNLSPAQPSLPKRPLDLASNPGALLSHIYSQACALSTTSPSILVRAVMAWTLEHTTRAWRQDVSQWIGWPLPAHSGTGSDTSDTSLRPPIALMFGAGQRKAVREPWSGAQVEQERDDRGELDIGYVLRPARIPSFVSLSSARQLLEAGRALHLLHTATDGQHPLLQLQRSRGDDSTTTSHSAAALRKLSSALTIPTWTFGTSARAEQLRTLENVLVATKNAGSRWVYHGKRRRVVDASAGTGTGLPSLASGTAIGTSLFNASSGAGIGGVAARKRHSSLRAFPSGHHHEHDQAPPPLPANAMKKVHDAQRADARASSGPELAEAAATDDDEPDRALGKALRLYDGLPGSHLLFDDADEPPSTAHQANAKGKRAKESDMSLIPYLARFCEAAAKEDEYQRQGSHSGPITCFVSEPWTQGNEDTNGEAQGEDTTPRALHLITADLPTFHLDTATRQTLLQPLLAWSRTVNAALVSVFFRDLAVDLYLATCQRFLLLGSEAFRARVVGVLFEDGSEGRGTGSDEDRLRARGKAGMVRQSGGVGLSVKLTSSSTWPPAGSELSVSLNLAVAETLAESKASHARLMASSRPLLSTSSLHAAEAALYDLDQRLSFSVIDMHADKPKSIHALDWLTLTFTPPPLISPLLQAHASACYQRLFNFLLRILRVQTVLRGLAKATLLQSRTFASPARATTSGPSSSSPNSIAHLLYTHDPLLRATLHMFRFEAQHFVGTLSTYVADVAIGTHWVRFQKRLRQLARGVGAGTESRAGGGGSTPRGGGAGATAAPTVRTAASEAVDSDDEGSSVWVGPGRSDVGGLEADNIDEESEDRDEEEAEAGPDGNAGSSRRGEEAFRLFNVFSLSRYHERVLDRMLQACFLKQRFRGIMKIINDLFQLILDLGQLIQDISAPAEIAMPAAEDRHGEDKGEDEVTTSASYAARERFYTLHARWKGRYALLAQSLRLVHLHSRSAQAQAQANQQQQGGDAQAQARTQYEAALAAAVDLDASVLAPSGGGASSGAGAATATAEVQRGSDNAADLELRRLEAEEELDLRALEDPDGEGEGGRGNSAGSTAGILLNLLALPVL
ncbi:hypothetical protein V8E36_005011 [Tilletia maclaganii]